MAIAELDELFAMLATPEDRATFESMLERAPAAKDRITTSEDLTRSLLDGDTAATARIEARKAAAARQPAAQPSTLSSPSSAQFDKTQFDSMVDAKVRELIPSLLKGEFEKEDFNSRVKGLVKSTADEMVPGLITRTTRTADEIFTIRAAHKEETGKPLDTAALTTFIEDAAKTGKTYGSYVDAYNDFVKEARIEARVAKGIADGVAAHPKLAPQVPGTSLGTGNTMAAAFVRANPLNKTSAERGTAIDQGAQALRQMIASRTQ
jgi:hypothetical protein